MMTVDKINISNTMLDRRRKLSLEQHEEIKKLYATGKYSIRGLGREFGVDKKLIQIIVNPEIARKNKERIKNHWKDYKPTKEERRKIMQEHRAYKNSLLKKGAIKL